MGRRSIDPEFSGDLFEDSKEEKGPRTMERDSGGIQGFEYFGVDTRDQEEDK